MRYSEILPEALSATSLDGRKVTILKNPSPEILVDRVKRTKSLRGVLSDGDLFWANSSSLIHVQIGRAIGASDGYGDARLNLRWDDGSAKLAILPNTLDLQDILKMPQVKRLAANPNFQKSWDV